MGGDPSGLVDGILEVTSMGESRSSEIDPIAAFTKEFAKQLADKLPIEAALTPAAEPTGQLLSDVVKTIQLALAPLQFLGAYQDRLRNFIDNSIRRVPEEKRIRPALQILGPIIENIRYEPEGTPIDAMFSELLSCSMDRDRVHEAHPAYPFVIRQLSADEAKILASLNGKSFTYMYSLQFKEGKHEYAEETNKVEIDELPRDGLTFPENVIFYIEHLDKLGLADRAWLKNIPTSNGTEFYHNYRLTEFGQRFVAACISDRRP
jgi:hypothetical protein